MLSLNNDCKFTGDVTVKLNDASLTKKPDANGAVSVTVTIKSLTSGDLDDPTPVTLHQGSNTLVVSGQGQTSAGASAGTVTIDATFDLEPAAATTSTTTRPAVVPVSAQTASGSTGGSTLAHTGANILALFAMALVIIVLGTHAVASRWAAPLDIGAVRATAIVSLPAFRLDIGDHIRWMLQAAVLTAASYILGPPRGRHVKKVGPRGLVPTVSDWIYRDR